MVRSTPISKCPDTLCPDPTCCGAAEGGAEGRLVEPAFEWEHIPLAMPMDTRDMPVAWDELEHGATVNVGNPHIVFFVPEADAVALGELGPRIETDPLFP